MSTAGATSGLRRRTRGPAEGTFNGATDVAWDTNDNVYVSDGYVNSRIAKFDKNGNWIKSWGQFGRGGDHANENPGSINNPHNIQIDRNNNVYVADRGNRRIQVFDTDGTFKLLPLPERAVRQEASSDAGRRSRQRPGRERAVGDVHRATDPRSTCSSVDSEPGRSTR